MTPNNWSYLPFLLANPTHLFLPTSPPTNLHSSSKSTSIQFHHATPSHLQYQSLRKLGCVCEKNRGAKRNNGNKRKVTKAKVIFLFVLFVGFIWSIVCVFTSNRSNHESVQLAITKLVFHFFCFSFFTLFHQMCVCVFVHKQLGRCGNNQPQGKFFLFYFLFLIFFHQLCVCLCGNKSNKEGVEATNNKFFFFFQSSVCVCLCASN